MQAAWGIHQMANEAMASAARMHAIERGLEISQFPMFAFGGAGPVHAYGVARILKTPRIVYPFGAGVMSAVGFLTAPLSFDFVRSSPDHLESLDWARASSLLEEMQAEGRDALVEMGISKRTVALNYDSLGMPGGVKLVVGADGRWYRLRSEPGVRGRPETWLLDGPGSYEVEDLVGDDEA